MSEIIKEIENKLLEIEEKENVRILFAVESGSRAWGFASSDSDYDVRFIYVRKKEDYLMLNEPRDVIEWQLDEVLDINGWDLKKALIQFQKGNASMFEWSQSSVVYQVTKEWEQIYDVAKNFFSVKAALYHYYGIANNTYHQYLQEEQVRYKKYFYALRPLLSGKYIQQYQCPPPILFDELLKMELASELILGLEELLEIKKQSDEKETGIQIPVIHDFIQTELIRQKEYAASLLDDRNWEWSELNKVFLQVLG